MPARFRPDRRPRRSRENWNDLDDAAVLEAGLAGDQQAWAELVERYGRLVYSIPRRHGLDRAASDDVFQEVFAIFVRQAPTIRRRTGLAKWFITTAHRVCVQWSKRARRTHGPGLGGLDVPAAPQELLDRWELQHEVRRALDRLGGPCRELLIALYSEQGPHCYAQIAKSLGIPEGSIGPTRARCLQKLLKLMQTMDEPGDGIPSSIE